MRILTTLPQNDLNDVPAAAAAAESAGFDGVITMENRHEPFLALAVAATASQRIELGTAVAIAFPRSPMMVASTCWDLQTASRGRFVLGIGPQIRPHIEKRFSTPWSAPVPRLREYVRALRAIWRSWETGERLRFEGEHYTFTLMTPNFTPASTGQPMVPVTIAAVGPHSLRLAGEVADGVRLHGFCTRRYLEEVCMPRIEEGMARSGRRRESFEVTGGGFVATGATDEEVAKAVEWVRYRVAFYGSAGLLDAGLGDLGLLAKCSTCTGSATSGASSTGRTLHPGHPPPAGRLRGGGVGSDRGGDRRRHGATLRRRRSATTSSPQRSRSASAAPRTRSIRQPLDGPAPGSSRRASSRTSAACRPPSRATRRPGEPTSLEAGRRISAISSPSPPGARHDPSSPRRRSASPRTMSARWWKECDRPDQR